jgi:hypothetical protein
MDNSSETLVEIPPPEVSPAPNSGLGLGLVSVAMVAGVVLLVLATRPELPQFDWEQRTGPGIVNLDSLVAVADGFAMLSGMTAEGVLLWSSRDGVEWRSQALRGAPNQLAEVDDGLIAYGGISGRLLQPAGESWLESDLDIVFPDEIRSRQSSGRPSVVGTEEGILAMSISGDVWWSADGMDFRRAVSEPEWGPGTEVDLVVDSACHPPSRTSPDVPPVVVTDSRLFTLTATNPSEPFGVWPVCEPRAWVSDDGSEWRRISTLTAGNGYVYDFAWREGRFTAVGGYGIGKPAVWTSTDGVTWETIDSFPEVAGYDLYTVAAGPAAWVVLGQTDEQSSPVGWTSLDGVCWEPLPWEATGTDVAVGDHSVLILDRTSYPEVWRGSLTGGTGSC